MLRLRSATGSAAFTLCLLKGSATGSAAFTLCLLKGSTTGSMEYIELATGSVTIQLSLSEVYLRA